MLEKNFMRTTNLVIAVLVGIGAILVGFAVSIYSFNVVIAIGIGVGVLAMLIRPRIGLYIMLLIAPLQNLFLLGNGATLVRYVGMALFAAWVLQKLLTQSSLRKLLKDPLTPPLLAFLFLSFLSSLWTPSASWQVNMLTYLQLGVWVFIMIDLIDSLASLDRALFWVFAGALVGAALAIYEYFTQAVSWQYSQRGSGGFDDPNYSSAIFMFILPYVLYRIRYSRGGERIFWLVSAMVLMTGVAFTVSRTGLLAIVLLLVGQFMKLSKAKSRAQYMILLVVFVLITVPLWPWENISYRFASVWTGGGNQDLGNRTGNWRLGWQMFIHHPVLGNGLSLLPGQEVIHNLFLSIAVKLGMIGVLFMLWLWISTWQGLTHAVERAREYLDEKSAELFSTLQLSMIIYLFFSLSLSTEMSRPQWFVFALGSIGWSIVREQQKTPQVEKDGAVPAPSSVRPLKAN
jgi:O-antigen ligase